MANRILQGTIPGEPVVAQILTRYKSDPRDEVALQDTQTFCVKTVPRLKDKATGSVAPPPGSSYARGECFYARGAKRFTSHFKALLIACWAWLGNDQMCREILSSIDGDIPSATFVELRESVVLLGQFENSHDLLTNAMNRKRSITDLWRCLELLTGVSTTEVAGIDVSVVNWYSDIIKQGLDAQDKMSFGDAHTLVSICRQFGAGLYEARYVHSH